MPRHRGFCQPMAGSPLPSNPESALTQDSGHYRQFLGSTSAIRKSDLLASISLLLVRKSDLLMSISLLLVSKSHFLVADELASFSDNLSTLRRTQPVQARGSAARVTPKATTFLKIFRKHRKNEHGFPSLGRSENFGTGVTEYTESPRSARLRGRR